MSALAHFADSTRTSPDVREVPQADICGAANGGVIRSPRRGGRADRRYVESLICPTMRRSPARRSEGLSQICESNLGSAGLGDFLRGPVRAVPGTTESVSAQRQR